ncbi:Clusterin-associated protein-1 [Carpediemonas membranifera]|uniref:Clusterin-associated protein-1 n=1 Tax=Carpediemonas membranifera TaxID=201153 RepID=A0A8J6B682_9EUKA|nr:Clusterin-associated protein-1 [Carpediemonas membranifera]|eukprot:KAG9395134.1 Clusterin-associated protein-1 [Carpediemonas membranifera]
MRILPLVRTYACPSAETGLDWRHYVSFSLDQLEQFKAHTLKMSVEKLRTDLSSLGYTSPITHNTFSGPNFAEVVRILLFLCDKFDLNVPLRTVDEVVDETLTNVPFFLNSIALVFFQNVGIQLDRQKLLKANSEAIPELLKGTNVLTAAYQLVEDSVAPPPAPTEALQTEALSQSGDLPAKAAVLYDLLEKTERIIKAQAEALDRANKSDAVQLKPALDGRASELGDLTAQQEAILREAESDKVGAERKLREREEELKLSEERLSTLDNVRPVFTEELSALEEKLQALHAEYVDKFMTLDYLRDVVGGQETAMASQRKVADDQLHRLRDRARQDRVANYLDDGAGEDSMELPPDLGAAGDDSLNLYDGSMDGGDLDASFEQPNGMQAGNGDLFEEPERARPRPGGDRAQSRLGHRPSRMPAPLPDDDLTLDGLDLDDEEDPLDALPDSADEVSAPSGYGAAGVAGGSFGSDLGGGLGSEGDLFGEDEDDIQSLSDDDF